MNIEGPVVVSRKGQARIERGHPWIFRSDIEKVGGASPGAVVRVADVRGTPLGFAFWSSRSEIRLRMIERGRDAPRGLPPRPDRARAPLARDGGGREPRPTASSTARATACRRSWWTATATTSPIQTLSQGTDRAKAEIVAALVDLLKPKGIVERNDPRVRTLEGLEQTVSVLHGEVPDAGRGVRGGRARSASTCARGRRPASSSTSARTTSRRGSTRAGACSTPSPTTVASRSRWRASRTRSPRSTSRPRRSSA